MVRNSKNQPSWEFLYRIYRRCLQFKWRYTTNGFYFSYFAAFRAQCRRTACVVFCCCKLGCRPFVLNLFSLFDLNLPRSESSVLRKNSINLKERAKPCIACRMPELYDSYKIWDNIRNKLFRIIENNILIQEHSCVLIWLRATRMQISFGNSFCFFWHRKSVFVCSRSFYNHFHLISLTGLTLRTDTNDNHFELETSS